MKKNFKGKAIYNPSGKAGEYSDWACNFYVGCSNGCYYCYLKKGLLAKTMGGNVPILKKCFKNNMHAIEIFENELVLNLDEIKKSSLFFSFTTDPMLEEIRLLTFLAISIAVNKYGINVKILTKRAEWVSGFVNFLTKSGRENDDRSWRKKIAFGFTLTGVDTAEMFASTNNERVKAMKELHDAGFRTFASIEPILDFKRSFYMMDQVKEFCDFYKVGLMSGDKYTDKSELFFFVDALIRKLENKHIYLKKSLRKQLDTSYDYVSTKFVEADYDMFKD